MTEVSEWKKVSVILLLCTATGIAAPAQTVSTAALAAKGKILHSFTAGPDGSRPQARLAVDSAGNLYGTTSQGGTYGQGVVFELMPTSGDKWTKKLLHTFGSQGDGGSSVAGLTFDSQGNLYGTTIQGGANGRGTVFELTPTAGGKWRETVLYSFCPGGYGNCTDGDAPISDLALDSAGNLYGATAFGGLACPLSTDGCGVVYEVSFGPNGWQETVLHSFVGSDGAEPGGGLIFDSSGNLYGTALSGGVLPCAFQYGCGVVYELVPSLSGTWTQTILRAFTTADKNGAFPAGDLVFDPAGNLYGAAAAGGESCSIERYGCGVVFTLKPSQNGVWTEQALHAFSGKDGSDPSGGLIFDSDGNLYGSASEGGNSCPGNFGCGAVFKLVSESGGRPHEYSLLSNQQDGWYIISSLVIGAKGQFYTTAYFGGDDDEGVVVEITP